jgi:hypothetical protein
MASLRSLEYGDRCHPQTIRTSSTWNTASRSEYLHDGIARSMSNGPLVADVRRESGLFALLLGCDPAGSSREDAYPPALR